MSKFFAPLVACLALGIVVAGCGGDDGDKGGGAAKTTEKPAAGKAEPAGDTVEVGLQGIKFDPASVTVKVGGTVNWTNKESIPHDVTKEDGPGPDFSSGNGNLKQGDTYKQTFKTAGTINYVCTIHPNMTGTVTVE
jgi:amicyanin